MYDGPQGEYGGKHPEAHHHLFLWSCWHSWKVDYKSTCDNPVEGQHHKEGNSVDSYSIVKQDHKIDREGSKEKSDDESEIQKHSEASTDLTDCFVDLSWKK